MQPSIFIRYSRQFLRQRRFWIGFSILFIIWIYNCTNLLIDWSDVKNWSFKKRTLPNRLQNLSHFDKYPGLDCNNFLKGEEKIFANYRDWGRIVLEDDMNIPMDCVSVKRRIYENLSSPEVEYTYAISRVVYKDYYWLEAVLSHTYSSKNQYCYSIDGKSSRYFVEKMEKLAECLSNVIIADQRYDFDSNGHFINYGHFTCSEELVKRKGWKYVLWAQNHDLILRTNQEVSKIIRFLNGSQAIGHKPAQWKRYAVTKDWSAKTLDLWKNPGNLSNRQQEAVLDISQNYNEVFISRELLEFVLNEMNYLNVLKELEVPYRFATDELFWATLIATEDLELPGAPREPCPDNRHYITRYNEWEKWYNPPCKSGFSRHGTCVFGMEYLPMFSELHQICANKIMPDFDYGFVKCYGELLHERTYNRGSSPKSMSVYTGNSRNSC